MEPVVVDREIEDLENIVSLTGEVSNGYFPCPILA